jgi:hypothetical protein
MTNQILSYALAVALGAGLFATAGAVTQEGKKPDMLDPDKMMEMWEKINRPGPEHAKFKEGVGTWATVTKSWMGPGEPIVSNGVSTMELVFDGRYLREDFSCTMMDKPFKGIAIVGFDNVKQKYVSVWLDNMSTGMMMMEGTFDEATKKLTSWGEYLDPMMGKSKMKSVMHEHSKDKRTFEMYRIMPNGQEMKEMEITYTRQS